MRPVNLIPKEARRGERAPLRAGALSYMVVGALGLLLAGIVSVVLTGNQVSAHKSELVELQARQSAAEQHAKQFAAYGQFATLSQSRQATVTDLAHSRFDWDRVLNELALVIPKDVWLQSLTGKVSPSVTLGGGADTSSAASSIMGPSLTIAGCADGQQAVGRFVAALKDIDGVTRVGLQNSSLGSTSETGATGTAPATGGSGGCAAKESVAAFAVTVAFDAVQLAAPAEATAAAPTAETAAAPATDDGGVAATEAEQQTATDSAAAQTESAQNGADAVGMGG